MMIIYLANFLFGIVYIISNVYVVVNLLLVINITIIILIINIIIIIFFSEKSFSLLGFFHQLMFFLSLFLFVFIYNKVLSTILAVILASLYMFVIYISSIFYNVKYDILRLCIIFLFFHYWDYIGKLNLTSLFVSAIMILWFCRIGLLIYDWILHRIIINCFTFDFNYFNLKSKTIYYYSVIILCWLNKFFSEVIKGLFVRFIFNLIVWFFIFYHQSMIFSIILILILNIFLMINVVYIRLISNISEILRVYNFSTEQEYTNFSNKLGYLYLEEKELKTRNNISVIIYCLLKFNENIKAMTPGFLQKWKKLLTYNPIMLKQDVVLYYFLVNNNSIFLDASIYLNADLSFAIKKAINDKDKGIANSFCFNFFYDYENQKLDQLTLLAKNCAEMGHTINPITMSSNQITIRNPLWYMNITLPIINLF